MAQKAIRAFDAMVSTDVVRAIAKILSIRQDNAPRHRKPVYKNRLLNHRIREGERASDARFPHSPFAGRA
jgi:hypothetical protein